MAWNGSGAYSRIFGSTGWVDDRNASTLILATRHDTHDQDLADGINLCITKDGQSKPAATITPNSDNAYDLGSIALRWRTLIGFAVRCVNNSGFSAYLEPSALTASRTISFPDAAGTIALAQSSAFTARRITTTQALAANATTDVIFNDASSATWTQNQSTVYAVGTGIFTAPAAGTYFFSTMIRLQNNTASSCVLNRVFLSLNNSTTLGSGVFLFTPAGYEASINAGSSAFNCMYSIGIKLALNDTVRVKVDLGASAGAGLTLNLESYFTGFKVP